MARLFTDQVQHDTLDTVPPLPPATCERWQPIRGGILNLYVFDYEEFRYERGHLILRGNNGTGKSRVMALQLPFLLDGRLASNRLEPDADPSKKMEWNLLMARHSERLGYTWIEFGRVAPRDNEHITIDGHANGRNGSAHGVERNQRFVTLGCGLSATRGSGMRDPWFFITDQRIGQELFLQTETGQPLSKSGLVEAIGDRGRMFETAKEYREAVDDRLFGLGRQRYEAMVDLLIQLRKPQLSRNLDEKTLAGVLAESLPPPSEHMIADVAESFRSLETDRTELERFRSACGSVDGFLRTFQRYAKVGSRRRAAAVRQTHSKYESVMRDLRQAEREHDEASGCQAAARAAVRSLTVQVEELGTRIETLRADPKMRSADAIKQATDDESQTRLDLAEAQKTLASASNRLVQRKTTHHESRQQAEVQLRKTASVWQQSAQVAISCDLKKEHDSTLNGLEPQLDVPGRRLAFDLSPTRTQLETIIAKRVQSSDCLKKRNETLVDAERELARAKLERDDAQQRVESAVENHRLAEGRRRQAVDEFLESYQMWRRDSDEFIMPSEDDISDALDDWSQDAKDANPMAAALRRAELDARQRLNELQARLQQQIEAAVAERSELEALATKLQEGFDEPPPLPLGADQSARSARAGAPFWSLVDFAPSCSAEQRGDIEAAMEAAGLLNAWVTPDGTVLAADLADVVLRTAATPDVPANASVCNVLVADPDRSVAAFAVSDAMIDAILRKIGHGEQDATTWIATDGRWRNGPLYGQCQRDSARYIGRDARELHRARQLERARADLLRLGQQIRQLEQQQRAIDERIVAIERQRQAFPADAGIREAASAIAGAMQVVTDRRKALTVAEQTIVACHATEQNARELRDVDARDLGLFEWRLRLDDLDRILADYRRFLAELWPSLEHFESCRTQCQTTAAAVQEVERDLEVFKEKCHDQETRYARANQRLKTLQETIGAEADQMLRELEQAEERRRAVQAEMKLAQVAEKDADERVFRTDERIAFQRRTLDDETGHRQKACEDFQRLCSMGLLKSAGKPHDEDPAAWSISRTVEIARQTESAFETVNHDDRAWDEVQQSVTTTIQDLNTSLSQHAFTPTLSTTDGLYQVTVPYQGQVRSVQELRDMLAEEVGQRQAILDEREREVIENHLIGEVATKLHEQIHQAYELVDRMNLEIQNRPMSTGMTLKFDWKPDDELSGGIAEVCKKLLAATGTWSPAERAAIGRYLQDHIKAIRAARTTGTWQEHLAEALDYRRWHRFWVMRKQDSGWVRLTKRTHGTGSGGEKAVALTIPQFAAAAAHYSSARKDAPRLILLDEAFVGIDPDMRGKCMELIKVFDLDFLMSSESEWGCYAGVPGVAIHQFSTRKGFEAVFLTRWIWNGKQRLKDDTPLPAAARCGNDSPLT